MFTGQVNCLTLKGTKMTLYQSTVSVYLQIIPSILRCFEKGRKFCVERGLDREGFVDARLYDDMLPLHFHIIALLHFSEGALNAAREGVIGGPDMTLNFNYDELENHLKQALGRLEKLNPDDVNNLAGGEVIFEYNQMILPFSTEDFFRTYASPHFYFRATILYSILRSKGVPLGIADYIGRVKTTPSSRFSAEVHQHTGDQYLEFLEQLAGPQVENL